MLHKAHWNGSKTFSWFSHFDLCRGTLGSQCKGSWMTPDNGAHPEGHPHAEPSPELWWMFGTFARTPGACEGGSSECSDRGSANLHQSLTIFAWRRARASVGAKNPWSSFPCFWNSLLFSFARNFLAFFFCKEFPCFFERFSLLSQGF